MQISESGSEWLELPTWVEFLIELGYLWPVDPGPRRRLGLVSMPVDSAAAGLIALGALRKSLEDPAASDVAQHFDRMLKLATSGTDTLLTHVGPGYTGKFRMDGTDTAGRIWATKLNGTGDRVAITRKSAGNWKVEGEPQVRNERASYLKTGNVYSGLMTGSGAIVAENLQQSDSSLCLSGRISGESPTRRMLTDFRIRLDATSDETNLCEILTIRSLGDSHLSRLLYYNPRTGAIDRQSRTPRLVVADGPESFAGVWDEPQFAASDVVVVVHREISETKVDSFSQKILGLLQWYKPFVFPAPRAMLRPTGISLSYLSPL